MAASDQEAKYGGFTRFEIELEFVQCLYVRSRHPQGLPPMPIPNPKSQLTSNPTVPPRNRANPHYISHLATLTAPQSTPSVTGASSSSAPTPLLSHPPFVAYLAYLRYFAQPPYTKYLTYPGPTLKNLELLQSERFRREILSPEVVAALVRSGVEAAERWHGR
ncbi:MAG: hypothetical protein M1818_008161 [Claussenomyces sp. TS43310]|nr:MAG: hypothetical protein M1818_008161 [Claussenomyces sp. TS43310]